MIITVRTSGDTPHIPVIEELNVTDNGTYTASAGVDGYSPVNVNVQPTLITKSIITNGTYSASADNVDGYSQVTVDVSPLTPKAVNFYDYDGTIVQSYTAAEFAELAAMPENPTHSGLTAQGWNWSLVDAKAYVASCGKLNIGQMYTTDDGATRLHIRLEDSRLSPVLSLCPKGTLTIDWGDNSPTETMTGRNTLTPVYLPHTYSQAGKYTISITPTSGSTFGFGENDVLRRSDNDDSNQRQVYLSSIIGINLGVGITSIGTKAYYFCTSLTSVTIPNNVTSIEQRAFNNCYSLTSVTIPNSVTSMGSSAFNNCYSLTSVTIPNSITSTVTSLFYNCASLTSVTIPNSVTSIEQGAFGYCFSLTSVTIPNNVTSIGTNAFNYCYSLTSVTTPNSITSIPSDAFAYCPSLTSVTIPNSVTSIGQRAFGYCYGLGCLKFMGSTPPTASSNAFASLSTDCIIYVPQGSLSDYTGASNYPSSSTYQYVEY